MEIVNHILVCLDLSEIDEDLVHYCAVVARSFNAKRITLTHVIQPSDIPKTIDDSFDEITDSLDEMIYSEFYNYLEKQVGEDIIVNIYTQIAEEEGLGTIVTNVKEQDVDMLLIGKKFGEHRKKIHSRQPFAESDCDITFVPENPPLVISKILCAIDYSEDSKEAFGKALYLQKNKNAELVCYHLQDISRTYFPATTDKSENYIQTKAANDHQNFLSLFGLNPENYPCELGSGEKLTSEAKKLYSAAKKNKADLIIIGATGTTANETSLLGNITETLRRMDVSIPIMVVKKPGKQKSP